jgi:hypothetical protein
MPKVHNKYHKIAPADAVYIGRPSKWGNPFSHMADTLAEFRTESRDEAVSKYREWLLTQPELLAAVVAELAGKDLVCWCAPKKCHGDVLLEIANRSAT